MRRGIGCVAVSLILVVAFFLTRGLDPPTPNPPGGFSFAVMGDAPYYWWEELRFRLVLEDLDAHDLTSVISIGDIFWRPCSDEMYRRTREQFNGLRHPVVYTPGDNEWFDCWEPASGGFTPQARLVRLREIFFNPPTQSLGGRRIALASQPEFVENVRWIFDRDARPVVSVMGVAAKATLGTGRLNLTGLTPNGHRFIANPRRLWLIESSRAVVDGVSVGPAGPLVSQASLGDLLLPQRGLFAVARARLEQPLNRGGTRPSRAGSCAFL